MIMTPYSENLITMEFKGLAKDWFCSYLKGAQQFECIETKTSKIKEMVCGVFQGSVFIILSFHISINDLDSCIKYPQVYQFAENNFLRYFAGNTSKYLSM